MALFSPDYEYIQGKAILDGSKGKQWDLVRYYVNSKDREISYLQGLVDDMRKVFKMIKKYIN